MPEYTQEQQAALRELEAVVTEYEELGIAGHKFFQTSYARIHRQLKEAFPDPSQLRTSDSQLIEKFDSIPTA